MHKCVGARGSLFIKSIEFAAITFKSRVQFSKTENIHRIIDTFFNCIKLVLTLPNCGRNDHNA